MSDEIKYPDPLPNPMRARPLEALAPNLPTEAGEFSVSSIEAIANPSTPVNSTFAIRPFVVDTNVLYKDLKRAHRQGLRTALLDVGSGGGGRIFCAPHVPAELEENLPEWELDPDTFRGMKLLWKRHYLPVLRVVDVPDMYLLTEAERRRVNHLQTVDPDDVPSAILGLIVNAPVLTEDKALLRAVYGDEANVDQKADWIRHALAGRALGEGDRVVETGLIVANTLGSISIGTVTETIKALRRMPPIGLIALLLGFGFGLMRYGDVVADRLRTLGRAVLHFAGELGPVLAEWQKDRTDAGIHLLSALPRPHSDDTEPVWYGIGSGTLERACIHVLCRSSPKSAARLAEVLPNLPVAQGEAKVRSVLRSGSSFLKLPKGRWQVGKPWLRQ